MKRIFALLSAASMITLLCCACGQSAQETVTIRLNEVTHSVFYAPQYVAIEKGFFADEGLEIELTNGGGADKVMTAVLANQSDIGLAGPESCIYVYNQGETDAPMVFAQLTKRDGSFLVAREPADNFSWQDLVGKTIIGGRQGGVPEMTLEYVMQQNGVIPNEDAVVDTSITFNAMAGAFAANGGDYVTLFEPSATEMERIGEGYIVASVGQESGEIPYTAYFATRSYLQENAEVAQKFTNAIARGQVWVRESSVTEVAEVIAPQFPDTEIEVLTAVVQRYKDIDVWQDTPVMEQTALERLETVMESAGVLPRSAWVPFDSLADNRFAENAAR